MRRNSTTKFKDVLINTFGFFMLILALIFGVAGVKYVVDNDVFSGSDNTSLPPNTSYNPSSEIPLSSEPISSEEPITSEDPITSEEPITSEDPITSEEPITSEDPVTSEEPQPQKLYGDFPSPLFDGPYSDYLLGDEENLVLNLNPHLKPGTIAANAYGTYIDTLTQGYYRQAEVNTNTTVDFNISANSLRYDNTGLTYKAGFSDTTLASDVFIDPLFYTAEWGEVTYTYTSVIVFDFAIVNENGWAFEVKNYTTDAISIFYRNISDPVWRLADEEDINYFSSSLYSFEKGEETQLAIAFQSNSKSKNSSLGDILLRLYPEPPPPDYNAEQVYRIMSNEQFMEEENYASWHIIDAVYVPINDGGIYLGYEFNGYYIVDLKPKQIPTLWICATNDDYPLADWFSLDSSLLSPGVNIIEFTFEPNGSGYYNHIVTVIENRPFIESDYNYK